MQAPQQEQKLLVQPILDNSEAINKRDLLIDEVTTLIVQLGEIGDEVFNIEETINIEVENNLPHSEKLERVEKNINKAKNIVKKIQAHLIKITTIENEDDHNCWVRGENEDLLATIISFKLIIRISNFPTILKNLNALTKHFDDELKFEYSNIVKKFEKKVEKLADILRKFINSIDEQAIRNKLLAVLNDESIPLTDRLEKFTQKNKDQDFNIYYQKFLNSAFKEGSLNLLTWFKYLEPAFFTDSFFNALLLKYYKDIEKDFKLIDDEREKAFTIIFMRVLKTSYNCEYNKDDLDVLKSVVNSSYNLLLNYDKEELKNYEDALSRMEQKAKEYKYSALWRGILEAMIVFLGLAVLIAALAGAIILFSLSLPLSATATFILLGVQLTALGLKIAAGVTLVTGVFLTGVSFFGAGILSNHSKHFDEKYKDCNELTKLMKNGQKFSLEALEQKSEPLFAEIIDKFNVVYSLNENDNINDDSKQKVIALYNALDAYAQNMQEITQIRLAKEKGVALSSISDERIKAELPKYIANDINENNRLKDIKPDQFEFILLISETAYKLVYEFNSKILNERDLNQENNLIEQLKDEYLYVTELLRDLTFKEKKLAKIFFKMFAPSISLIDQAVDIKLNEITALYNEMYHEGVLIPPYSDNKLCIDLHEFMKRDQSPMQKFSELKEFINESLENNLIPEDNYFVRKIVEIVNTPLPGEKELQKMSVVLGNIGGKNLENFQNVQLII